MSKEDLPSPLWRSITQSLKGLNRIKGGRKGVLILSLPVSLFLSLSFSLSLSVSWDIYLLLPSAIRTLGALIV
jgi:hypothetical protein